MPPSRNNINPHSPTFSIDPASAANASGLPSSLVIENPRRSRSGFYLNMARLGFPMNAIRKDAPIVGGCREKNPDNRSTFER
jgi:hypothetical protein